MPIVKASVRCTLVHKPSSLELSCHCCAHWSVQFNSRKGTRTTSCRADTTPARHKNTHTHTHHHIKRKGFIELFARCLPPFSLFGHAPLLSKSVAIPALASNTLWRTFCRALSRGWLNFGYADTEEEHARIQRRNSSLSLSRKGQRPCRWTQKGWGWLNFSTRQSTPSVQGRIH